MSAAASLPPSRGKNPKDLKTRSDGRGPQGSDRGSKSDATAPTGSEGQRCCCGGLTGAEGEVLEDSWAGVV